MLPDGGARSAAGRLTRPDSLEYLPSFVWRGLNRLTRLDVAFTTAL
jgi:hypothetical protein